MWDRLWPYLTAILPTIIVATLFYFLMKSMLQGDHRERLAQSKWEAEQDRLREPDNATDSAPSKGTHSPPPDDEG